MEDVDDLVAWLRAQLDEDERVAKTATSGGPWRVDGMSVRGQTRMNLTDVLVVRHTWPQEADHIVRHDPARVLREVEAKRRIIDQYTTDINSDHWEARLAADDFGEAALRLLALPYADRPGYQEEWKP